MGTRYRGLGAGDWVLGTGRSELSAGTWVPRAGYRVLEVGCWVQGIRHLEFGIWNLPSLAPNPKSRALNPDFLTPSPPLRSGNT